MSQLDHLAALRRELLIWFQRHQRDLPWRRTREPYAIWLSEIMLQQTRVAAVIPYFERFLARFPDVQSLASAPESDLLAHWAGLGYYYRARNLKKAAELIVAAGCFPSSYEDLLKLPGVGEYTAAAVASIAFNLPHAVLDGNVFRVLSRIFSDSTNIASANGKKHFSKLAEDLLDRKNPAAFNQALMELGATICAPKSPQCLLCPVAFGCKSLEQNTIAGLPVKIVEKKNVKVERLLFWIERANEILVWQRAPDSRLMPGFWELPEIDQLPTVSKASQATLGTFRHGITIYDYTFTVVEAQPPTELGICRWMSREELENSPASTVFRKASRLIDNRRNTLRVQIAVAR